MVLGHFLTAEPSAKGGAMLRSISVAVIAVLVLSACQSGPFWKKNKKDPLLNEGFAETGLMASLQTRFPDIPLPVGAKEDMERTFVYESSALQIGRMVYTSKHSVNEVTQFYIKEAPKFNWILTSVLQAEGAHLSFEKPGKLMQIVVRVSGIVKGGSLLIISLTPDDRPAQGRTSIRPL